MNSDAARESFRTAGIAVAVLLLHLALLQIFNFSKTMRPAALDASTPVWVSLLELEPEPEPVPEPVAQQEPAPAPAPNAAPTRRAAPAPAADAIPSAPAAPATSAPQVDRRFSALAPYALCGVREDGKPCDKVHWDLQTRPLAPRAPTPAEIALTQQFERDLAVQNAAPLVPCASPFGFGLSLICVLSGALNGFDFKMASYADSTRPECGFDKGGDRLCGVASSRPTLGGMGGR